MAREGRREKGRGEGRGKEEGESEMDSVRVIERARQRDAVKAGLFSSEFVDEEER